MGYSLIGEKQQSNKVHPKQNVNEGDNFQHVQESSDMAQTIKELNDDRIDDNGFSKIDMKSRLISDEISAILTIDTLIKMSVFPKDVSFLTLKKERISVSQDGKGRQEIVDISKGIQGQQSGHSILDGIGNIFRGGQRQ
jgi:hypothetical protein